MPKAPAPALRIDLSRARAQWYSRQGLAEPSQGAIEDVIAKTGWLRTLGGADVYLAARARKTGMAREELDAAKSAARVRVLPAVRGCIYLVPASHAGLALRLAEEQHRKKIDRELEKAGTSVKEVVERGAAILATLASKGPLTTDALRKAVPAEAVRSLGEQGKKVGISSTLPVSLRELEFAGKIERTLEDGKLDSERYLWRALEKGSIAASDVPKAAEGRHARLAELFFGWVGPATVKDFAEWSGLTVRDAKAAVEKAPLAPVAVDGYSDEALALAADLAALKEAPAPSNSVRLLSFEDNFLILHGGPRHVTAEKHHGRSLAVWGSSKPSTIADAKHITTRTIVTSDGLAGLWEYDPETHTIVTTLFEKPSAPRAKELAAIAADTAAFLQHQIGHAKIFSLDNDTALRERVAALRAM